MPLLRLQQGQVSDNKLDDAKHQGNEDTSETEGKVNKKSADAENRQLK